MPASKLVVNWDWRRSVMEVNGAFEIAKAIVDKNSYTRRTKTYKGQAFKFGPTDVARFKQAVDRYRSMHTAKRAELLSAAADNETELMERRNTGEVRRLGAEAAYEHKEHTRLSVWAQKIASSAGRPEVGNHLWFMRYQKCINAVSHFVAEGEIFQHASPRMQVVVPPGQADSAYTISEHVTSAWQQLPKIERCHYPEYPHLPTYMSHHNHSAKLGGYYAVMHNAYVLGYSSFGVVANCEILWNPGGCYLDGIPGEAIAQSALHLARPAAQEKHAKLAVLTHHYASSFYHSVAEMLSRLMLIHRVLMSDRSIKVLVHENLPQFTLDALAFLGIEKARLVEALAWDRQQKEGAVVYLADTMWIPKGAFCGAPLRWPLRWLRDAVAAELRQAAMICKYKVHANMDAENPPGFVAETDEVKVSLHRYPGYEVHAKDWEEKALAQCEQACTDARGNCKGFALNINTNTCFVKRTMATATKLRQFSRVFTAWKSCPTPEGKHTEVHEEAIVLLRRTGCANKNAARHMHRKLLNFDDLYAAAQRAFPYTKIYVHTGGESFVETLRMMQAARVIVGIHGAALTNTIFARPGTHVLEYLVRDAGSNGGGCYLYLSTQLQLQHHVVFAPPAPSFYPGLQTPDVDQFVGYLRSMFS
jgi:hypothetical protein